MPRIDRPREHGFRAGLSAEALNSGLFTYCLSDGAALKIGKCSGHPSERLHTLQTGSSRELKLLAYTAGNGSNSEARVHNRLARYRLRGEWFELCLEVLAEVRHWDWLAEDLHRELTEECIQCLS
jgi:hypothetical protein